MSVHSFVGPAGSGKTTRLMDSLEARLRERPLIEGQRVLAVTRMHGARHRLDERLANGVARGQCDCMTMDRLAWVLAMRWRSRLKELGGTPSSELDFDETCRSAALLLGDNAVSAWLARRYPIVIVDEFQDCRDGRLGIVRALSASCELLLAADDFQDLTGEAGAPAVDWLKTTGNREELEHIHRTDEEQLLGAANALREGRKLSIGWSAGFSLVPAPNANVAASFVARAIRWSAGASLVVLSPTGPARSKFVRDALERLAAKPFEDKRKKGEKPKTFGPYKVPWEQSAEASDVALRDALGLLKLEDATIVSPAFSTEQHLPGRRDLEQWLEHCRRVKGRTSFTVSELREAIGRAVQHHRAHARPSSRLRAMTIQQAKNQEFDRVVVLWPFEIQGDAERLRRLLYNAVTRAKKYAAVIVQDPKKVRLGAAPFE